ncbi:MAG TPA: hypothetical protein VKE22_04370 [Haliangiales bacterium]|nr:hypothetical protein [Haliangiales bacterium]
MTGWPTLGEIAQRLTVEAHATARALGHWPTPFAAREESHDEYWACWRLM